MQPLTDREGIEEALKRALDGPFFEPDEAEDCKVPDSKYEDCYADDEDDLYIMLTKDNLHLVGFTEETEHLVIPESVVIDGKVYLIGNLDDRLFENNQKLVSVEIDMSSIVTDDPFGVLVFSGCKNLKRVKISSRYPYFIFGGMFRNCSSLERVELAPGLKEIYEGAFSGCSSLTEFDFSGVGFIGDAAFESCVGLKEVSLDCRIEERAFADCINLRKVELGRSSAGDGAFQGCTRLQDVQIAEGARSFGDSCFADCSSLKEIVLPSTAKYMGDMFPGCSSLKKVTLKGCYKDDTFLRWLCISLSDDVELEILDLDLHSEGKDWMIDPCTGPGICPLYRDVVDFVEKDYCKGLPRYNPEHEEIYQNLINDQSKREEIWLHRTRGKRPQVPQESSPQDYVFMHPVKFM